MEGLDPKRIDWLRSLSLVEKKEVNGIRFSLTHNLPEKNYGGDLRPANATENFDQLLVDMTVDRQIRLVIQQLVKVLRRISWTQIPTIILFWQIVGQ